MEENIDDQVHWRTSTKMIITLNESTLLINPSHKRCFIFTIPFFMSRRWCKEPINFENALKTQVLFVELLVSCLGLWVSSSLGFKARVDHSLVCFLARWSSELLKTILFTKESWFQTVRLYAPLSIAFFFGQWAKSARFQTVEGKKIINLLALLVGRQN